MSFTEVTASIRYAAAGVFRLSGRDGAKLFWPWAVFLVLLTQAVTTMLLMPAIFGAFFRIAEAMEARNFAAGPAAEQALAAQMTAQMATDLGSLWMPLAAINAIAALLLAAAVTRRLHDRDRTAWWGLLPLPFMAISLASTPNAFALAAGMPGQPGIGLRLALLSTPLFWGSLLWLGVLLAGAGTRGPNRFGEATRETP